MLISLPADPDHARRCMSTTSCFTIPVGADRAAEQAHTIHAAIDHLSAYAADLRDRASTLCDRSILLREQSAMLRTQSRALRATTAAIRPHHRHARRRIHPFP